MHRFREAVEKDPYDTIFGWSNDILHGRPVRARWFREDDIKSWTFKALHERHASFRDQMLEHGRIFDEFTGRAAETKEAPDASQEQQTRTKPASGQTTQSEPPAKKVKVSSSPSVNISVKQSDRQETSPHPTNVQAYSQWSYSGVDASGKTYERSGASVYDPISGRMVPVQAKGQTEQSIISPAPSPESPSKPEHTPTSQTGTADAGKAQASTSMDQLNVDITKLEKMNEELRKEADDGLMRAAGNLSQAAVESNVERNASSQLSNSLGLSTLSRHDRRLQLFKQTEQNLRVAQSTLKSMIHAPKQDTIVSLLATQNTNAPLQKTLVCLHKTQLALQAYRNASTSLVPPEVATSVEKALPSSVQTKKANLEQSWRSEGKKSTPTESPHFSQARTEYPLRNRKTDVLVYQSLHRHRKLPLKQMSANDLQMHRALLLSRWANHKPQAQKIKSEADKRLEREINDQKSSFAAWENRWSRRAQATSTAEPAPAIDQSARTTHQGAEGDVCTNVGRFCNPDRMYKRRAPHAQMESDPALAARLKEIYETKYGVIDESHRQPNKPLDSGHEPEMAQGKRMAELLTLAQRNQNVRMSLDPLTTSLQRHSGQPSAESKPAPRSDQPGATPPFTCNYLVVKCDENGHNFNITPSTTHPDGWTYPRVSVNTAMEILRSKQGYKSTLYPNISKLSQQGYVLHDIARDERFIVFKRRSLEGPKETTASLRKAVSSHVDKGINPVDPSLRPPPPTQTGNFASPTGFVNFETPEQSTPVTPRTQPQQEQPATHEGTTPKRSEQSPKSRRKVRKQEEVFSGPKSQEPPTPASEGSIASKTGAEVLFELFAGATGLVMLGFIGYWIGVMIERAREPFTGLPMQRGLDTIAEREEAIELATSMGLLERQNRVSERLWRDPRAGREERRRAREIEREWPVGVVVVEGVTCGVVLGGLWWVTGWMLGR